MHPTRQVHLPAEIILHIVHFVAADEARRQAALYACCLVSHQWYSAAISFLYEKPRVDAGNSFIKFTETVCPGVGGRRNKLNLGSFVHRLDLSRLVHHSSNSLTARLLGRVKENLEVFLGPRVSFAVNSLPALSKCVNLRHLDLSLVADPIPFDSLKKALNHLTKLITLRLPQSTNIILESPFIEWPPLLQRLQLSGRFSPFQMPSFSWPPSLTSLTLKNCADLSVESLGSLISSPQLGQNLKRLTISGSNRGLQPESINAIPAFLPELEFLSIPGDMVEESFFELLLYTSPPLSLKVLELGLPIWDDTLNFPTQYLVDALDKGLANLRSVGFSELFCTEERIYEDEEIERALQHHARKKLQPGVETGDDEQVGVYYL